MATGYIVGTRGDLDLLFKARASAAAANTGFLSNGGVDLAQRFEPRGSSTAIAATGFKSGATDLATIFMDINAVTDPVLITRTMTAGNLGSPSFNLGYRNTASGYAAYPGQAMSAAPEWTKGGQLYRLDEIRDDGTTADFLLLRISHATVEPPNNNNTWSFMSLTGVFANSGGASVKRSISRAMFAVTNNYTSPNGRPGLSWQGGTTLWRLIQGNSYTLEIG